ncbi:MAG: hypothetical protein JOZ41_17570 [Chloroflexi bacterium]|nr:hypothetical protein [Chloroflexota bacterium]
MVGLCLAGCGSAGHGPSAAAVIGGHPILPADVQAYVDYSVRFDAWANHQPASRPPCAAGRGGRQCALLRRQALIRLLQERVVQDYARRHGVRLTAADQSGIDRQLAIAAGPGSTLLRRLGVSRSFLRAVLARQMLVQRVEAAVAPDWARQGPSVHVRRYVIPYGTDPVQAREEAVTLAIDGKPIPAAASIRDEWIADFRLAAPLQETLAVADPGQFAGPYDQGSAFLVIQLLGRGTHRYGRPAREELASRYFHTWLAEAFRQTRPVCYGADGKTMACPPLN